MTSIRSLSKSELKDIIDSLEFHREACASVGDSSRDEAAKRYELLLEKLKQ